MSNIFRRHDRGSNEITVICLPLSPSFGPFNILLRSLCLDVNSKFIFAEGWAKEALKLGIYYVFPFFLKMLFDSL